MFEFRSVKILAEFPSLTKFYYTWKHVSIREKWIAHVTNVVLSFSRASKFVKRSTGLETFISLMCGEWIQIHTENS